MRNSLFKSILLGGTATMMATCLISTSYAKNWKPGDVAPNFSGKASDGKTHSLKNLTASGPVLLYFIGESCPVNAQAVKYYNRVADAYKGKATVVGIIDGGESEYKQWQSKFKAPFPVIFDKNMNIIKTYKAERSPWAILVGKDGKIIAEWSGYSASGIAKISESIAKAAKIKPIQIDTTGAPAATSAG